MAGDWRSYGSIAAEYDRIWGSRFVEAARFVLARLDPAPGVRLLDGGTGTGAVPTALREEGRRAEVVGFDLSPEMLDRARRRVAGLRVTVADAAGLPFRGGAFDAVTLNFVLSHVGDYHGALAEARRVLREGGALAVSNWGSAVHACEEAWGEILQGAIDAEALEGATGEVVPWEGRFAEPERLEGALVEAGFAGVRVDATPLVATATVEEFVEDRGLSTSGRYARHVLGAEGWARLRREATTALRARFGPRVEFGRTVLVAVGRKPRGGGAPGRASAG